MKQRNRRLKRKLLELRPRTGLLRRRLKRKKLQEWLQK